MARVTAPPPVVLVGFGRIAEVLYAPELVSRRDQVTVVEPSAARRDAALAAIPGVRLLDELSGLPRAATETVALNLVPGPRHAEVTERLLDLGHHVFSEKPAARSAETWHRLVARAEENGCVLTAAPVSGHLADVEDLIGRVRSGEIGTPTEVHGTFIGAGPARRGYIDADRAWFFGPESCVIRDLAPYVVAPMVRLLGGPDAFTWYRNGVREPVPVRPSGAVTPAYGSAATGIGRWRDVLGRIEVAYRPWASGVDATLTVVGTTGAVSCDLDDPPGADGPGRAKATGAFDLVRRAMDDPDFRTAHVADVGTALTMIDAHRDAVVAAEGRTR